MYVTVISSLAVSLTVILIKCNEIQREMPIGSVQPIRLPQLLRNTRSLLRWETDTHTCMANTHWDFNEWPSQLQHFISLQYYKYEVQI